MKRKLVSLIGVALVGCAGVDDGDRTKAVGSDLSNQCEIAKVVDREDIVSTLGGEAELETDLQGAWGLTFTEDTPATAARSAWVTTTNSGLIHAFDENGGATLPVTLAVPAPNQTGAAQPTASVLNPDRNEFVGDKLMVVTARGLIVGINGTHDFVTRVDNSATAKYTGVTIAPSSLGHFRLYAANLKGGVDVFDDDYLPVALPPGAFTDSHIPVNFHPFNVEMFEGRIFVSYVRTSGAAATVMPAPGDGFVNIYDVNGALISRLIGRGAELNAPYGMQINPDAKGSLADKLIVGNYGDGRMNVYELVASWGGPAVRFDGPLAESKCTPIEIPGLLTLRFGRGHAGLDKHELFFTAAPPNGPGKAHGVFGEIDMD